MSKFDMRSASKELQRAGKALKTVSALVGRLQARLKKEGRLEWEKWHRWHDAQQEGRPIDFSDRTTHRTSGYAARLSDAEEMLNGFVSDVEIARRNVSGAARILSVRKRPTRSRSRQPKRS